MLVGETEKKPRNAWTGNIPDDDKMLYSRRGVALLDESGQRRHLGGGDL